MQKMSKIDHSTENYGVLCLIGMGFGLDLFKGNAVTGPTCYGMFAEFRYKG